MGVYWELIRFGGSLKWPLEELQLMNWKVKRQAHSYNL